MPSMNGGGGAALAGGSAGDGNGARLMLSSVSFRDLEEQRPGAAIPPQQDHPSTSSAAVPPMNGSSVDTVTKDENGNNLPLMVSGCYGLLNGIHGQFSCIYIMYSMAGLWRIAYFEFPFASRSPPVG